MTTYELKNLDVLLKTKRDTTEKIIYILTLSEKKKLTTKEIYQKGKEVFGDEFPKNKITVLRYLNTMLEYGMVKKDGWYWNLVNSKIPIEEIVAKLDIESIKESLKYKDGTYNGIVAFPDISLYNVSPLVKKYFEKELSKIIGDLKKISDKVYELNMKAIEKHIEMHEKIEEDQTLTTFDKWIIHSIGIVLTVTIMKSFIAQLLPSNFEEWVTRYKKEANITDEVLFLEQKMLKYLFLKSPPTSIFIRDSDGIKLSTPFIMPMAALLKKFHPEKSKEWLINRLTKYRCSEKIMEKIHEDIRDFATVVRASKYYAFSPTIVINPRMRKKLIRKEQLPSNYKELLHNFLISNA